MLAPQGPDSPSGTPTYPWSCSDTWAWIARGEALVRHVRAIEGGDDMGARVGRRNTPLLGLPVDAGGVNGPQVRLRGEGQAVLASYRRSSFAVASFPWMGIHSSCGDRSCFRCALR